MNNKEQQMVFILVTRSNPARVGREALLTPEGLMTYL
jgi:hypothetical protein